MAREVPKQPDRDPLTKGERQFLSGHDKGEFAYSWDDRAMLDACCHRGLLTPVEGEFLIEHISAERVRLKPVYRLTERGSEGLAWQSSTGVAAP